MRYDERVMNERTCRVVHPPSTEACGARPAFRVFWPDGEATDVCQDSALYLRQVAGEHHTVLRIEPLVKPLRPSAHP